VNVARVALVAMAAFALSACSGDGSAGSASELRSYVGAVEPIRLSVNRLLDDADPVLDAYRAHTITPEQASARMDRLERRFAGYMVAINALKSTDRELAKINAGYAHTFILEDSYLSALAAALPGGDFAGLPNTQSEQRAAIIEWRTQLEILARQRGLHLPADLQQAGRGEIAPSPSEGS
jgi:hypothetical protein